MSTVTDTLMARNETFATTRFSPGLTIIPALKTTIIGCVDPRVDPAEIFGLLPGEAAVLRNVGGRIYPSTLQSMGMLGVVAKTSGSAIGTGWNLVVLHHTDCGIRCLAKFPELLARHFGVETDAVADLAITDPHASVVIDVAALKANPNLSAELTVSGLVYDVATGRTTVVVPPGPIRVDPVQ